jgi:hypothetical protein
MNNRWRHDDTLVQTMRVRASGLDRLTARLRAEKVLQTVRLRPTGLSNAAVFCVRHLRVKRFPIATGAAPDAWRRDVQAAMDDLLRTAIRPAQEAVPANAEAVLFTDQSEMLACLARDWLAGVVPTRWWWQSLLRGGARPAAVVPLWIDSPEHVPAALAQLAADGKAAPFVRALGPAQAQVLLRKVLMVQALPQIVAAIEQSIACADELARAWALAERPVANHPASERVPPWQSWVPEADDAGLKPFQQLLVGMTLMLQRQATVMRSPTVLTIVSDWCRAATGAPLASPTVSALRETASKLMDPPPTSPDEPTRTMTLTVPPETALTPDSEPTAPTTVTSAQNAAAPGPVTSAHDAAAPRPIAAGVSPDVEPTVESCIEQLLDQPRPPRPKQQQAFHSEITQTELGGVFYLINLGLFLELYGDFTSPARPGLALPIWDFVFLLGKRLLDEPRTTDPVWDLLARLAGRGADTPPGQGFEPPDAWRLPADWLRPFPEADAWSWSASADRLRVWHPAGFPVIDVPPDGAWEENQFAREITVYGCTHSGTQTSHRLGAADNGKPPLERWLDWLLPYVRARLCRALGVTDTTEAGALLLVHRAQVITSATRVDVTTSLAELPIAIRLAGLDRDPGWVPAAGRFVAFHYE